MQDNELEFNHSEEAEVAQVNSLITNQNAINAVQKQLAEQRKRPSAEFCEECGEDIPQARRDLVPGVQFCIHCQARSERFKANYRQPGANSE